MSFKKILSLPQFILFLAFCLITIIAAGLFAGCVSSAKQSQTRLKTSHELVSDYHKNEITKQYAIDSMLKRISFTGTITERIYHPPDSSGHQYLEKETTSQFSGESETTNTRKEDVGKETDTKKKENKRNDSTLNTSDSQKTDSYFFKIKSIWVILYLIANVVIYGLYFWTKRKKKDTC